MVFFMSLIEKLKKRFEKIINIFAAGSGRKQLGLRFGSFVAVLTKRNGISFDAKGRSFDYGSRFVWIKRRGDFYLFPNLEANPHIVISGMSGFGKSTLFKSLLSQIVNSGISCLVFDAHNEHCDIVRALEGNVHSALYSGINILELDGASISERISELTRLFKEIYSLGYIQSTKLSECLWYTYRKAGARSRTDRELQRVPGIRDLLDELSIFIRNSKTQSESNTLAHLRDRISLLNSTAFSGSSVKMDEIVKGLNSFSLAGMKSKESQLIYIGELLGRLYAMMHDGKNQSALRLYIMIDEAQFLIDNSSDNSIIAKLIEEGRKYGIGVIIVTHAASTLNKKIIANSSVFMSFYAREPSEIGYISRVLSGGNGLVAEIIREKIGKLQQNEAVLVGNRFRMPVVVATPKFDEIESKEAEIEDKEAIELLNAKAKRPIIWKAFHSSNPKLKRSTLDKLIKLRHLDSFVMPHSNNEEWMMWHNPSLSIEHEVWIEKIQQLLKENKVESRIVDNSSGPDIVAFANGKKMAIEYETGSKSPESTKKMIASRLESYEEVIIVTKAQLKVQYEQMLGNFGIKIIDSDHLELLVDYARGFSMIKEKPI